MVKIIERVVNTYFARIYFSKVGINMYEAYELV